MLSRPSPETVVPSVVLCEVWRPALVLGSTQSLALVDAGRAASEGIEIVHRHSGGAAVLVRPGELLWVDVLIPSGDPLWDDDVGRAVHWIGQTWTAALAGVGVDASWHDGALVTGAFSHLACFAGLGPGEVTIGGRKVVGVSQRRTRAGALFQCAALLAWDPAALAAVLQLADRDRDRLVGELTARAAAVPVDGDRLEASFLSQLARQ